MHIKKINLDPPKGKYTDYQTNRIKFEVKRTSYLRLNQTFVVCPNVVSCPLDIYQPVKQDICILAQKNLTLVTLLCDDRVLVSLCVYRLF